jgi:hypothetical protein
MLAGCVLGSFMLPAAASAADEPFMSMKGNWALNVRESHWSQGGGLTGGVWEVRQDDGKRRQSLLVQNLPNGRINVFWFDGGYDGKLEWCNDWYREGYKRLAPNSFSVAWEAEPRGQTIKGGPDICKYNEEGTRLTCVDPAFTEVYDKVK